MKLDLTGLHIEITDAIRDFTKKKVSKLDKFFNEDVICHVTISAKKDKQNVNIRIEYMSKTYLSDIETNDIYSGLEDAISKIEGQIRKTKSTQDKVRKEGIKVQDEETDIEELDN